MVGVYIGGDVNPPNEPAPATLEMMQSLTFMLVISICHFCTNKLHQCTYIALIFVLHVNSLYITLVKSVCITNFRRYVTCVTWGYQIVPSILTILFTLFIYHPDKILNPLFILKTHPFSLHSQPIWFWFHI